MFLPPRLPFSVQLQASEVNLPNEFMCRRSALAGQLQRFEAHGAFAAGNDDRLAVILEHRPRRSASCGWRCAPDFESYVLLEPAMRATNRSYLWEPAMRATLLRPFLARMARSHRGRGTVARMARSHRGRGTVARMAGSHR